MANSAERINFPQSPFSLLSNHIQQEALAVIWLAQFHFMIVLLQKSLLEQVVSNTVQLRYIVFFQLTDFKM